MVKKLVSFQIKWECSAFVCRTDNVTLNYIFPSISNIYTIHIFAIFHLLREQFLSSLSASIAIFTGSCLFNLHCVLSVFATVEIVPCKFYVSYSSLQSRLVSYIPYYTAFAFSGDGKLVFGEIVFFFLFFVGHTMINDPAICNLLLFPSLRYDTFFLYRAYIIDQHHSAVVHFRPWKEIIKYLAIFPYMKYNAKLFWIVFEVVAKSVS